MQFFAHLIGAVLMVVGLFLYYGKFVALQQIDPVLGIASVVVFVGMVFMLVMVVRAKSS